MFAPRSDSSVAHQGFRLTWNSTARVCGGTVTGETRGVVTSPGWPGRYPHQADCSWVIRYLLHIYTTHYIYNIIYTIYNIIYGSVSPGSRVQLQFASLNLESHPDCGYDRLGQSEDIPRFPATFLYIQIFNYISSH